MADVILHDRNGKPVTYRGVTAVQLETDGGGRQTFEESPSMKQLYNYACVPVDGGSKLRVVQKASAYLTAGENGLYVRFSDAACREYGVLEGDEYVTILVTSKKSSFVVGETYTNAEMLN